MMSRLRGYRTLTLLSICACREWGMSGLSLLLNNHLYPRDLANLYASLSGRNLNTELNRWSELSVLNVHRLEGDNPAAPKLNG